MKTVTIYSTPTCGFCKMLKAFLESQSILYSDRNVADDDSTVAEMQQFAPGNMSVPVIVFNKGEKDQEVQIGYDQPKVEKALGL